MGRHSFLHGVGSLMQGCNGESRLREDPLDRVKLTFPSSAEVVRLPPDRKKNLDYRFIVREQDGTVWYVTTLNYDDNDPDMKVMLFKPLR